MDVFISHSRSDDKLARLLAEALAANGISTWPDGPSLQPGERLADAIERAVKDADNILLLIGTEHEPSPFQQSEWQAALKAAWGSPTKRLIPLLIGEAKLPTFVRSANGFGQAIQVMRIQDPQRDWQKVVGELVKVLQHKADLQEFAQNVNTTEEDRAQQQQRLAYLKRAAETFKP
jgi:hypothetical protein